MAANEKYTTAAVSFTSPVKKVWKQLLNFRNSKLYGNGIKAYLDPDENDGYTGTFVIGDMEFSASFVPYEIRLTADDLKIGIALQETDTGCKALMVAAYNPEAIPSLDRDYLVKFLNALKDAADTEVPALKENKKISYSKPKTEDIPVKKTRSVWQIIGSAAAVLFILVCLAGSAWAIQYSGLLKKRPSASSGSDTKAGSELLSADTAELLYLGEKKQDVDSRIGKPVSHNEDTYLYTSSDLDVFGDPAVQVQITYSGEQAQKIVMLDLNNSTAVGAVTGTELTPSSDSNAQTLAEQAGCPVSMIRKYYSDGSEITEYHFGYLDPKANFSKYWTGELWASVSSDDTFRSGTSYRYDGSDPLMVSDLEDTLLARQYTSYEEYLANFYEYIRCLSVADEPSLTECGSIFTGMTVYSSDDTSTTYTADAFTDSENDPNLSWNYSLNFDVRDEFILFYAVNTALWETEGQLEDLDLSSITRNQDYSDVMKTIGLLPDMVYIDYSYVLLGFGAYKGSDAEQTQQFEYMVRFTKDSMTVESIYDNTGKQIDLTA